MDRSPGVDSYQVFFDQVPLSTDVVSIDFSGYNVATMSGLQGKRWLFFVWDDANIEHLDEHSVKHWEAEQVFFNRYVITPNKMKYASKKYRIDGTTDSGRRLRLIFEDLGKGVARIFTGWDL